MKYALVVDGAVKQVQPNPQEGFIKAPGSVVAGQIWDGSSYVDPAPQEKSIESQIDDLEQSVTARNLRGAALGDAYAVKKIQEVEDQINALRGN